MSEEVKESFMRALNNFETSFITIGLNKYIIKGGNRDKEMASM